MYIAKVLRRFLLEAGGLVDKLEMRCLMPKYGSGNTIDDTPELHPEDIGQFKKEDVIAGPLTVTCKPREKKIQCGRLRGCCENLQQSQGY